MQAQQQNLSMACLTGKIDDLQLINEVKKRRVLWDSTMRMSERKDTIDKEWLEIACLLNVEVSHLKKRFKSLRDHYRYEVRRMQNDPNVYSRWMYFKRLDFLRNIFDPNDILENRSSQAFHCDQFLQQEVPEEAYEVVNDAILDVDEDDSFGFDVISEDIFTQGIRPVASTPPMEEPPAKKSRNNRSTYKEPSPTNVVERISPNAVCPEKDTKDDSDYSFLISMLPHMKSLSEMGNLRFRIEVSKILMDIKQNEIDLKQRSPDVSQRDIVQQTFERLKSFDPKIENGCRTPPEFVECEVKIENN